MTDIFHITSRDEWAAAQEAGVYTLPSLAEEKFIHCSTISQILIPADDIYKGREDLVLLRLDPEQLTAPLVYEDCYETGIAFPHVYGPINLDAVVDVIDFPPRPDGLFDLPPSIKPPPS